MRSVRPLTARLTLVLAALLLWKVSLFGLPPNWKEAAKAGIADLKSDKVETRRTAAARLGEVARQASAPRTPEAVAALIEALKDPDSTVRANAVESLPWVGGRTADDPQVRAAVTKSDLPAILAAVKDPEAIVRAKAVGALALVNTDAKTSATTLSSLLSDPVAPVRVAAVRALGTISGKTEVLPSVLLALKDKDAEVRAATIHALGVVGIQRTEVVPAFIASLRDRDPVVQRAAAGELGDRLPWNPNGPNPAKDVVPILVELARDKSYPSRSDAVWALGRIHPDAALAVPVLTEALKDPDVQQSAVDALLQYGTQASAAIPSLRELAKTAKADPVRREVVVVLVRIDPDREDTWTAFQALPPNARRSVTRRLLSFDRPAQDKATLKAVLVLLKDPDVKVRASSVDLLHRTLAPDAQAAALPLLLAMLKNKEAPAGDLADALGPMKALAKTAVPDLLNALAAETDEDERDRILSALKRIDPEAAKKAGKP